MESIENNGTEAPQISTSTKIGIGVGIVVLIAALVGVVYYLLQETTPTARIRDVFIILLGFELLVIGFSAILLIVQGARLFNMFQNEINKRVLLLWRYMDNRLKAVL